MKNKPRFLRVSIAEKRRKFNLYMSQVNSDFGEFQKNPLLNPAQLNPQEWASWHRYKIAVGAEEVHMLSHLDRFWGTAEGKERLAARQIV